MRTSFELRPDGGGLISIEADTKTGSISINSYNGPQLSGQSLVVFSRQLDAAMMLIEFEEDEEEVEDDDFFPADDLDLIPERFSDDEVHF